MASTEDLVRHLHGSHTYTDKLLIIMHFIASPTKIDAIKAGFNEIQKWNVSSKLRSIGNGYVIRSLKGWQITSLGSAYLVEKGCQLNERVLVEQATTLRSLVFELNDVDTKQYLTEAIKCIENRLYRASVVMTWSAAIHILKKEVEDKYLNVFNDQARKISQNWRTARTSDDLGLMNEKDFLDRLENISLIGKDVKRQLQECLTLRNSCGHPNSLRVEKHRVASCLEILILNVFQRFCI